MGSEATTPFSESEESEDCLKGLHGHLGRWNPPHHLPTYLKQEVSGPCSPAAQRSRPCEQSKAGFAPEPQKEAWPTLRAHVGSCPWPWAQLPSAVSRNPAGPSQQALPTCCARVTLGTCWGLRARSSEHARLAASGLKAERACVTAGGGGRRLRRPRAETFWDGNAAPQRLLSLGGLMAEISIRSHICPLKSVGGVLAGSRPLH